MLCQYFIDYLWHSKYQISNFYIEQNVGTIIIDWDKQELKLQVRDLNGTLALEQVVKLEKKKVQLVRKRLKTVLNEMWIINIFGRIGYR